MLSKNPIRMLCFVVPVALRFLFVLDYAHATQAKYYPNCCIKEISNFRIYCNEIFQIVANKMELEVNENIPKPIILIDTQLTLQQFNSYLGWESKVILPCYFHERNILVIPCNCKLDTLVHEYVHYFQAMYQNRDLNCTYGMSADGIELEAIIIQRWFKTKFMRPRLPQ